MSNSRLIRFLVPCLISVACLGACIAPASMQSGRTLGKGKKENAMSLGMGKFYFSVFDSGPASYIPIFEYTTIWGVLKDLDLVLKVNSTNYATGIAKYQIIGSQTSFIALSAGAEVGISPFSLISGAVVSHLSVPVYFSLHPYDNFALYGTPRYLHAFHYIRNKESSRPGYHTLADLFALSYGIIIGSKYKFLVEASHYHNSLSPSQISIGYAGPLFPSK